MKPPLAKERVRAVVAEKLRGFAGACQGPGTAGARTDEASMGETRDGCERLVPCPFVTHQVLLFDTFSGPDIPAREPRIRDPFVIKTGG